MSSVTVRRRSRSALVNEPAEDASETKGTKRTIARGVVSEVVWYLVMQFYGFIVFLGFAMKAVTAKRSFRLMSSEEKRNYDSARERLWDLSRKPYGLTHNFFTLKNGKQLHYVYKSPAGGVDSNTSLVIFIHGFPDSWFLWHPLLRSSKLVTRATLVAVDLPNYGGSDSVDVMDASTLLNALAEFTIAMRQRFLPDDDGNSPSKGRVILCGHDWGGVVACKLAAEAPQLADRFIVSNTAHPPLLAANVKEKYRVAKSFLRTWYTRPRDFNLLTKAWNTIKPVIIQIHKSGYIFVFNLPKPVISFLGDIGDHGFMRYLNAVSTHHDPPMPLREVQGAQQLASSNGPRPEDCGPTTVKREDGSTKTFSYGPSVKARSTKDAGWLAKLAIYREGFIHKPWEKSLEVIVELDDLDKYNTERRRSSGSGGLFETGPPYAFKVPVTVIWGKDDIAIDRHLNLGGINDYFLAQPSHVVMLSGVGHWTLCSPDGVQVFEAALDWTLMGESGTLNDALSDFSYARITAGR